MENGIDYEARDKEIARLRFEENRSLQEIGDLYGISRERIRQIVGNSGFRKHEARRRKVKSVLMTATRLTTNSELAQQLGVGKGAITAYRRRTGKKQWHMADGIMRTGIQAELTVSKLLINMDYKAELMPWQHPFDILINDVVKADVKCCATTKNSPSQKEKLVGDQWHFRSHATIEQREHPDVYLLYIQPLEELFIIPPKDTPEKSDIVFVWPNEWNIGGGKYAKFNYAWEILDDIIKQKIRNP